MIRLKKVVSLLLAFALVFGSMSALSYAVMNDGNENTLVLQQKFFRETTGSTVPAEQNWVETTKVEPGEKVKVRMYFGSDFNIGTASITYFFNKDVLIPNFDSYPMADPILRKTPVNTTPGCQAETLAMGPQMFTYTGDYDDVTYPDEPPGFPQSGTDVGYMVFDGVLTPEYFDEYGFVHMTLAGNRSTATSAKMDISEWVYELDFTVASTATPADEIKFLVNPDTVRSASGYVYGTIDFPKFPDGKNAGDGIDMDQWDCDFYTIDATVSVENSITFNAGAGTFAGGSSTSTLNGIIGTAATAPTLATTGGANFVGWVPSTVESPTADDVVTTFEYGYDAITYNALYQAAATTLTFNAGEGSTFTSNGTATRTLTGTPGDALDTADIESDLVVPTGMLFNGWSPAVPETYPSAAASYTAQWRVATDIAYTMNTYTMGTDGEYVLTTETGHGATGSEVSMGITAAPGFNYESALSNPSGSVAGDGSTVLNVYFSRNKYAVTFDGATTQEYFGAAITPPADPTRTGYTFGGWTPTPAATVPVDGASYAPVWTPAANAFNIVGHYTDTADVAVDNYDADGQDTWGIESVTANSIAIVESLPADPDANTTYVLYSDLSIPSGYSLDEANASNVFTGTVVADGSTELHVYYSRNSYNITFNAGLGKFADESSTQTVNLPYGSAISKPATDPTRLGYTFAGWTGLNDGVTTVPVNGRTFAATWTANNYTVTYAYDAAPAGAPAVPTDASNYNIGDTFTAQAPATFAGYTFDGWTVSGTGATLVDSTVTVGSSNVTLTGSWTANNYTAIFMNGTTQFDSQAKAFGATITAPAGTPTKAGYAFEGWSTDGTVDGIVDFTDATPETMPVDGVTYYAAFSANPHTITYNTVIDGETTQYTVVNYVFGDTVNPMSAPAAVPGYNVSAWVGEPATIGDQDYVVTATYTAIEYTVTYEYSNTIAGAPAVPTNANTYNIGDTFETVAPDAFPGYVFSGWTVSGTGASLSGTTVTVGSENITLTGSWNFDELDVTYAYTGTVPAGAPAAPDAVSGVHINEVFTATMPTAVPGYEFSGWTASNVTLSALNQFTMPATDVALEGSWTPIDYNVTYSYATTPAGATALPANTTANIGDVIDLTVPTATGYDFNGWVVTGAASQTADDFTVGTSNITVVGSWTAKEYTLKYFTTVDGVRTQYGETQTVACDAAIVAVATPAAITGYSFGGWQGVPATMPANNVEIEGEFTKNTYTAYFYLDDAKTELFGQADYLYDAPISAPATDPQIDGKTFDGWGVPALGTMPAADVEFVADFIDIEYEFDFIGFEGDTNIVTYYWGDAVVAAEVPEVEGYSNDGKWYTDETFETEATIPATIAAPDFSATEGSVVEYYANYTVNQYDARFYIDGELYDTISVDYMEEIPEPAAPDASDIPAGFRFDGWDGVPGIVMDSIDGMDIDALLTDVYSVTYVYTNTPAGAPAVPTNINTYASDETFETVAPATLAGYTFSGWTVSGAGASLDDTTVTVGTANVTLTGTWDAIDYNITYSYANTPAYGTAPAVPTATTANVGDAKTVEAAPTLAGYIFSGWATEDATVTGGAYAMPADDVAFTGTWTAIDYTVSYAYTGEVPAGAAAAPADATANIGDAMTVAAAPSFTGYTFSGWTTADVSVAGGAYTMPADDVAFTGSWIPATGTAYTVNTYTMGVDGEYVLAPTTGYGTTGATADATPSLPQGFSLNADASTLTGTILADGSLVLTVYIDRNTYAFTTNVDGVTSSTNYLFGAAITTPATPTKTGYTFSQWVDGDNEAVTFPTTMPVDGLEVTAEWTANSYNATFDAGEGVFGDNEHTTVVPTNYDDAIVAPADPTRAGYTFDSWTPAVGTMDDVNGKTFTAVWTADTQTYTVTTHTMLADGTYAPAVVENKQAVTDTIITLVAGVDYTVPTGYSLGEDSVLTGTVPATGTLALSVYFDRDSYTVKTNVDGVTAEYDFLYGAAIAGIPVPTKVGYVFNAWSPALPETMPADDLEVEATWTAVAVSYTINYYDMAIGGDNTDITRTDSTQTAITGTEVTLTPAEVEGFTLNAAASDLTKTIAADGSTVFSVYYTRNQYVLTVEKANGEADDEITYYYDADVAAPAVPTRTGYTFNSWSPAVPTKMPAAATTVTAQWDINSYTLEFVNEYADPTTVSSASVEYGAAVNPAADQEREGYTFLGWAYEGTTEIVNFAGLTMPADDVTFEAQWQINTFDVVYRVDGVVIKTYEDVEFGATIPQPANPTKTGYTFSRWNPTVPATMPNRALTFNAQFTINSYDITYYVDGVLYDTVADQDYNSALYTIDAPTKTGYSFSGWSSEDVAIDSDTGDFTVPAGDVRIDGTFSANTYNAVFNAGEGEFADHSASKTVPTVFDAAIVAPAAPTRAGYNFTGWDATVGIMDDVNGKTFNAVWASASGTAYTVTTYTMGTDGEYTSASQILYGTTGDLINATPATFAAGFELNTELGTRTGNIAGDGSLVLTVYIDRITYTFTSTVDGVPTTANYLFGASITAPATPTKSGYTFSKWVDGSSATVTFPAAMPVGGLTVTAVWTANNHNAIFNINGEEYDTVSYAYGATIVAPAYTVPAGYSFVTWVLDPATMGDADQTYNATLTPNSYDVSFSVDGAVVLGPTSTVFGTPIATPENPEKEGFTFVGWYTATTGGAPMPVNMPAEDITYYAVWGNGENTRYTINIYSMDVAGNYNLVASTVSFGTTGNEVAIAANNALDGFTLDSNLSTLSGTIVPDGSLVLSAYYARDTYEVTFDGGAPIEVYYGASIVAPTPADREGQRFTGWSPVIPASMPANDIDFESTWGAASFTITYVIDGAETVVPYDFGAAVTTPETPVKAGHEFTGWSSAIPATMPAQNLRITAEFAIKSYTVQYRGFNNEIIAQYSIVYGEPIPMPGVTPVQPNYTFTGWTEIPAAMPASNISILANFDRVDVTLVPADGSTTVIDSENGVIYGLKNDITEIELRNQFLAYTGDGRIELTRTAVGCFGTGATVELYDNLTGELLETYRIVIFGDVNGDARTTTDDVTVIERENLTVTDWSYGPNYRVYTMMAADLNGDNQINAQDVTNARMLVLAAGEVNQATGVITPYI